MAHTKRIIAPAFWRMGKKTKYWAVTPSAASHPRRRSIPLLALLRDVLRLASTAREAKAILNGKQVMVDGRVRRGGAYPVGLMDVVKIGEKLYRIVPYRLGLKAVEIDAGESGLKLLRVVGKTALKKGKLQVNLHDGRNLLASSAGKGEYGIGDSVLLDTKSNNPVEVLKIAKGQTVLIFDGTHRGETAKVASIQNNGRSPNTAILEGAGKKSFETLTDYVLVVSPKVSLQSKPAVCNAADPAGLGRPRTAERGGAVK